MNKLTTRQLSFIAFFIFLLSRLAILVHRPFMTDVDMYYELSKRVAWGAMEVYKDFAFAYPFLSWLAISWPPLFDGQLTHDTYQTTLHVFFFALELVTITLFARKFWNQDSRLRLFSRALIFYSIFSLFQADLIYDRVDLMMTLSLIVLFVFWESWPGLSFILGFLLKLVPMALWPLKFLELWKTDRKRALISVWIPLVAIGLLVLSDTFFFPGELGALSNHSSRGIQIESIWATPFLLLHLFGMDPNGHIVTSFGAQEIQSDYLSDWILELSKYFGFAVLAFIYLVLKFDTKSPAGRNRAFLIFLFTFFCFQRVLSTQFLLWAAPFLGLSLALEFSWAVFTLSLMTFALTCTVFEGYGELLSSDPFFTALLALRNLLLLVLFALSLRSVRSTPNVDEPTLSIM